MPQLIGISVTGLEPEFQPVVNHLLPHIMSHKQDAHDMYLQVSILKTLPIMLLSVAALYHHVSLFIAFWCPLVCSCFKTWQIDYLCSFPILRYIFFLFHQYLSFSFFLIFCVCFPVFPSSWLLVFGHIFCHFAGRLCQFFRCCWFQFTFPGDACWSFLSNTSHRERKVGLSCPLYWKLETSLLICLSMCRLFG